MHYLNAFLTQSPIYLSRFRLYEEVDTAMLLSKQILQLFLEALLDSGALARYGHGLAIPRCCVLLYDAFDLVVVDVICGTLALIDVSGASLLTVCPCRYGPLSQGLAIFHVFVQLLSAWIGPNDYRGLEVARGQGQKSLSGSRGFEVGIGVGCRRSDLNVEDQTRSLRRVARRKP